MSNNQVADLDATYWELIDQLIPTGPEGRGRRLVYAAAVVIAAVTVGLLWRIGYVLPEPTLSSTQIQSTMMRAAPDGEHVIIGPLAFNSTGLVDLELAAVELDAPGLVVDRITWTDATALPSASDPLMMADATSLPAGMPPGARIDVWIWARPDTCTDPDSRWGEVNGRWGYLDRPAWWGRWESLDNPLWVPGDDPDSISSDGFHESALGGQALTADGETVDIDGPLSGACTLLGIDQ